MRDDFSSKTKEILARRVGYICSNPTCRKHTIGPNSDQNKAVNIGVAAHITAASPGGARYDEAISSSERESIENGIWLCSNCASLIDRDEKTFTVELLHDWKDATEKYLLESISGKVQIGKTPFLEADMLWDSIGRHPNGYSVKNIEVFEQPIPAGTDLYQYWTLIWRLKLVIYNNSEIPAYNIEIIENEGSEFKYLEKPPRVNNIKPFDNIELEAIYEKEFHGTSTEADEELTSIPKDFSDKILLIKYFNDNRDEQITQVNFDTERLINEKL
ncbi:hypothetical protein [Chryseobacterium sp. NKUCC03_KSP]|uniref:hypothetical protein n=1 Tax=Chryseobacterium sp. NKUCC03_KSP TaxID=2842125 RepID=UPI001C5BE3FE|nr:hypothetical protein [Chryseobacterium sp. NKUCC03_KSP]MBW3521831.1 hypothetical protein [Chryseobacterium sp. NKUCC03_KSP]